MQPLKCWRRMHGASKTVPYRYRIGRAALKLAITSPSKASDECVLPESLSFCLTCITWNLSTLVFD